jgi:hypothetical protein
MAPSRNCGIHSEYRVRRGLLLPCRSILSSLPCHHLTPPSLVIIPLFSLAITSLPPLLPSHHFPHSCHHLTLPSSPISVFPVPCRPSRLGSRGDKTSHEGTLADENAMAKTAGELDAVEAANGRCGGGTSRHSRRETPELRCEGGYPELKAAPRRCPRCCSPEISFSRDGSLRRRSPDVYHRRMRFAEAECRS